MNQITHNQISSQFPDHMVQDAPLLVAFMETYYRYEDQRSKATGSIQNLYQTFDIDLTEEDYVVNFYNEYGSQLPREVAMDRRNFIKILNQIYNAKGTEKALKLIFQAVFNEKIEVSFPGESRLRASDGIWVRENYITLETKFGTLPDGVVTLSLSNSTGDYTFETTRTEVVSSSTIRCYFRSFTNIKFDNGQRVFHFDSFGQMVYAGDLIPSPAFLSIVTPGQDWQVGQVVVIPGTDSNTVAKVTSVSSSGGITGVQIIEYGSYHPDGQIITTSPYPNKPSSSSVVVDSQVVSTEPLVYLHTLSIEDFVSEISENVVGISDSLTPNSYFLEDYVEQSYVGTNVFTQSSTQSAVVGEETGDLTIQQWLASRATLAYHYEDVVKLQGYYLNEQGQLSNQAIKLQDNYFYQAFSYLIETSRDITEYRRLLQVVHPAGTKRFSTLSQEVVLDVNVTAQRDIYVDSLAITESNSSDESVTY